MEDLAGSGPRQPTIPHTAPIPSALSRPAATEVDALSEESTVTALALALLGRIELDGFPQPL
jgi:hypothetical protein